MSANAPITLIAITLPIEISVALKKIREKDLTVYQGLIYLADMPNEPALDKVILSFQVSAALRMRLEQQAAKHEMKLSTWIAFLLTEATKNVVLTSKDYEEIKKIVRKNELGRAARRSGRSN